MLAGQSGRSWAVRGVNTCGMHACQRSQRLTPMFSSQRHRATMTARKIPKPGSENQRAQRDGCGGFACAPGVIRVRRGVRLTTILHEIEMPQMRCTVRLWTCCCIWQGVPSYEVGTVAGTVDHQKVVRSQSRAYLILTIATSPVLDSSCSGPS